MIIEWVYEGKEGKRLSQRNLHEQNSIESTNWKKVNVFKEAYFFICLM